MFGEQRANQVFSEKQHATGESCGKRPIEHCRLPFDEGFIVKDQGHSAEHGDHAEADPEHGVDLAVLEPDPADLGKGCGDCNTGRSVDAGKLERNKKQDDGEQIEEKFHG